MLAVGACGGDGETAAPLPPYVEPAELQTFPYYQSKWLNLKQGETVKLETPFESWSLRWYDHKGGGCVPAVCSLPERITAAVEVSLGKYHSYGLVPMARSVEEGNYVIDFSAITVTTPTYTGRMRLRTLHPNYTGELGKPYAFSTTTPVSFPAEGLTFHLRGVEVVSFCTFAPVLDVDYQHRRYRWSPGEGNLPAPYVVKLAGAKPADCNIETLFDTAYTLTVTKR
jgi:hypothetical protein